MTAAVSAPRLRLGNYEPLLELAAGGMATVYVARQIGAAGFERLVVIKRVHSHHLGNREFYEMFKDEARIASLVKHPNVVSVIDVVTLDHNSSSRLMETAGPRSFPRGPQQGELFLVMEYVESAALSMLLKAAREHRERLPPPVAARIITDTLAGLHAAHQAIDMHGRNLEVIHRDVSPQNIIVGVDGTSRLIDFGVAKAANRLTETKSGSLKGKIAYMSPEQTLGGAIDRRVDIFAAGVALHETLTGRRLFRGENDFDTMRRVSEAPIPDPSTLAPDVPKALDEVVQRALQRAPIDRYQTAQEFLEAIEGAITPAPVRDVASTVMRLCVDRIQERREKLSEILGGKIAPLGIGVTAEAITVPPTQGTHELNEVVTSSARPSSKPLVNVGDVIIGKFRVESILGEGGMGVVVSATHLQLDEPVALKFLRPEALQDPEAVARFSQEARAAAKLKSEHVARVLDVSAREDGTPFIVMEQLRGQDLRQLLDARGHLEILEACDYVIQACEALAEAHARGIIHRDIKPENLFLVERSEGWRLVKVLDFGISKAALTGNALGPSLAPRSGASAFNTSAIMGSPHYMSPEQLRSTADVDHRADIWSIGAVLFELLTGHTAFEGSGSLADLIATILEHPAPGVREIRVDVPEGLEAIVKRCLERDRALRYPNAAELAIALLPFAPRRARLAADRALSVTREAGLSDPHLQLPPSMAPPAPDSVTTNPKIAANGDVTATSKKFEASSPRAKNYRALGLMAAIGFGVGAALFGALVVFHKHKPADSPPIATTLASVPTTIPADPAPSASTPSIATTTTPIASTSATTAPTSTHEVHATTTIKHPSSAHPTATSHSNPDLEIRTTR